MAFVIGLLTFILIVDCILLVLLVLIQLPKKEAGAGVAFGGAATDALFGAGSGNVLTKTTKYAAVGFFVLAVVLSILQTHHFHQGSAEFRRELERQRQQPARPPTTPETPAPAPPTAVPGVTTGLNLLLPNLEVTNAPPSPPPQ